MKNIKSLKQLRNEAKLTREEVAKMADITTTYLYMIETGKRNAGDKLKKKLAEIYDCDAVDIFLALQH